MSIIYTDTAPSATTLRPTNGAVEQLNDFAKGAKTSGKARYPDEWIKCLSNSWHVQS